MTGACAGGGSGAGIRLSKVAVGGAGAKIVVGSRIWATRLPWWPSRAKPEVDPTTQAAANTTARSRHMTVFLLGSASPRGLDLIPAPGHGKMRSLGCAPDTGTKPGPLDPQMAPGATGAPSFSASSCWPRRSWRTPPPPRGSLQSGRTREGSVWRNSGTIQPLMPAARMTFAHFPV